MPLNPPASVPFVFVNGTIIDATQVNADFNALISTLNNNGRIAIVSPITVYVAPTGVDAPNNGTPGQPFATIQYAYNQLVQNYQMISSSVGAVIQLAAGTYPANTFIGGVIPGQQNDGQLQILGSVANPDSVVLQGVGPGAALQVQNGANITLTGVMITNTATGGVGLSTSHFGLLRIGNVDFGACTTNQVQITRRGLFKAYQNFSISGGGTNWLANNGGDVYIETVPDASQPPGTGPTITINGTPAWSSAFIAVSQLGMVKISNVTFVNPGNGTGPRYSIIENSVIHTGTSGALVLPGSSAGSSSLGGVYN